MSVHQKKRSFEAFEHTWANDVYTNLCARQEKVSLQHVSYLKTNMDTVLLCHITVFVSFIQHNHFVPVMANKNKT